MRYYDTSQTLAENCGRLVLVFLILYIVFLIIGFIEYRKDRTYGEKAETVKYLKLGSVSMGSFLLLLLFGFLYP